MFRLLLIFDVESALAAASAAVGRVDCCYTVRAGAVVSFQSFPDGWTAMQAALLGIVLEKGFAK